MKPKKGIRQAVESKPSVPRKSPANKPAVMRMPVAPDSPLGVHLRRVRRALSALQRAIDEIDAPGPDDHLWLTGEALRKRRQGPATFRKFLKPDPDSRLPPV